MRAIGEATILPGAKTVGAKTLGATVGRAAVRFNLAREVDAGPADDEAEPELPRPRILAAEDNKSNRLSLCALLQPLAEPTAPRSVAASTGLSTDTAALVPAVFDWTYFSLRSKKSMVCTVRCMRFFGVQPPRWRRPG